MKSLQTNNTSDMPYTLINKITGDVQYNAPVSFYTAAFIYMIDGTALKCHQYSVKTEYTHDYDIVFQVWRKTGMNEDARRMFNNLRVAQMYRRRYRWHKRVNGGRGLEWVINSKNEKVLS